MSTETYTLRIQGFLASQFRENILHFSGTGVDTNDTHHAATDIVSAFNLHLQVPWLNMLPATYSLHNVYARRTFLKPSAYAQSTFVDLSKPGTRGTDATAQQTCPCVFQIPTMGGLSGGRLFLPCVPQGDIINNAYSAGFVTAVDAFMAAATGGIAGTSYTWQLVIASKVVGASYTVASWYLSPGVGFIKKRKLLSGRGAGKKKA